MNLNFIKFGNRTIAPAGAQPTPIATSSTSDAPNETMGLARLLQSKIKELEVTVAARRARRQEWRTKVSRQNSILVELREEDRKEGEKLAKLEKRWKKATLAAGHDLLLHNDFPTPRHMFDLHRDHSAQEGRFMCPTTQAASAFNGNDDRYRDTYTFSGSVRQGAGSVFSSPPRSPVYHPMDERHNFRFVMSPEGLDTRRDFSDTTPTRRGYQIQTQNARHRAVWGVMSPEALDTRRDVSNTTPTRRGYQTQTQNAGNRAVLGEIRNTSQDVVGEGHERKRKSADFFADAHDGPYKKMKAEENGRYGFERQDNRGRRYSKRRSQMDHYYEPGM
ncbi:hypothetical protein C8R44DRAFT_755821 [Mycena epipterygia]|nr:hypothetical protein C8R44DRAFT_755821 [Mycena epipterygia]